MQVRVRRQPLEDHVKRRDWPARTSGTFQTNPSQGAVVGPCVQQPYDGAVSERLQTAQDAELSQRAAE